MTSSRSKSRLDVTTLRAIPTSIWALGFVSLFMDVSSELIHALLPVYMVTGLGASMLAVGVIEGIAEATASITKLFSGVLSDWLRRRKLLALVGYGLAALTKPIFPLAPTLAWIAGARFVDRIGKGIRGAPRDALVADLAPTELRGASFGLRQSLDTVGAFLGPLAAIVLMSLTGDNFHIVFWFAVVPAVISVALLLLAVKEPASVKEQPKGGFPLRRMELARLGGGFWLVIALTTVFTLSRFSEAFLLLRAQSVGLAVVFIPAVLVVMNIVYAAAAYPAGVLSDSAGRIIVMGIGLIVLVMADIVLAWVPFGIWGVFFGVALWGLHMGFTQGVLATLVADAAPQELRGTAFGVFNLVSGVVLLAASVIAGALWTMLGPSDTFIAGAGFAVTALVALAVVRRRGKAAPGPSGT